MPLLTTSISLTAGSWTWANSRGLTNNQNLRVKKSKPSSSSTPAIRQVRSSIQRPSKRSWNFQSRTKWLSLLTRYFSYNLGLQGEHLQRRSCLQIFQKNFRNSGFQHQRQLRTGIPSFLLQGIAGIVRKESRLPLPPQLQPQCRPRDG